MTDLDQKNVWKIVRQIRKSFLSQNPMVSTNQGCQAYNKLLSIEDINDNIKSFGEKLELKTTYSTNRNVSVKTLKTAAFMFTYLNFCPHAPTLTTFLQDLFYSRSAKNILLALASIMKSSRNAEKEISTKVLMKAMEIFKLSIYRDIDVITKEKNINDFKNFDESIKTIGQ